MLAPEVLDSSLGQRHAEADARREVREDRELAKAPEDRALPQEPPVLGLLEGRKASPFLNATIAHLAEKEARFATEGFQEWSWGPRSLPYSRLHMHLDRLTLCGAQGSFLVCSDCLRPSFVRGSCSSSLHSQCAKIQTQRIRKKLERDMVPAPHHYIVFTLPEQLRGTPGDWRTIDAHHTAVRRTIRSWLGQPWDGKKSRWWAA